MRGALGCCIQAIDGVAATGKQELGCSHGWAAVEMHLLQLDRPATSLYWEPLPNSPPAQQRQSSLSTGTCAQVAAITQKKWVSTSGHISHLFSTMHPTDWWTDTASPDRKTAILKPEMITLQTRITKREINTTKTRS